MRNESAGTGRWDMLEGCRFLCTMMIMAHHCYAIGISRPHPFCESWIFVEWFYLVSGFLTFRHFARVPPAPNACESALRYTWHKFRVLLPYTTVATLLQYFCEWRAIAPQDGWKEALLNCRWMPFDLLLLSSAGKWEWPITYPRVVPLWYLSAMLIVFPWLCMCFQLKNKSFVLLLSCTLPLLHYGRVGLVGRGDYPNDMLRAFSCMFLGALVYFVSEALRTLPFLRRRAVRLLLSAAEAGCFLLCVVFCAKWRTDLNPVMLLLFFVQLSLLFSGLTLSSRVQSRALRYLGKLSLPAFVLHWSVGTALNASFPPLAPQEKIALYYAVTLVFSALLCAAFDGLRKPAQRLFAIVFARETDGAQRPAPAAHGPKTPRP